MSLLSHLVIFGSYALVALALGLGLPKFFTVVTALDALAIAAVALLIGGQVHAALFNRNEREALVDRINALRRGHRQLREDLDVTRQEFAKSRTDLQNSRKQDSVRLVQEMQVLQGLLEQIAERPQIVEPDPVSDSISPPDKVVDTSGDTTDTAEDRARTEQEILEQVEQAVEANRIDLFLQPVVSLPQRKVRFYECFSHLRDEQGNLIHPGKYMDIAEQNGIITVIDNMLLFRCVQLIRRLQNRDQQVRFFCNISSFTLDDGSFFNQFLEFLENNKGLANALIFEFSQLDIGARRPDVDKDLARLADLGFRFSMDKVTDLNIDFADLARYHVGYVKIPADLLLSAEQAMGSDIRAADLKTAFKRYNIDLIVEKIESEKTVIDLLDYQIDFGQGYLFGEPRPSPDNE